MMLDLSKINNEKYLLSLQKKYGKTYYFATLFFPTKIRKEIATLYAFFRIPDEIVDNSRTLNISPRDFLVDWKDEWKKASLNNESKYLIINNTAKLFFNKNIPFEYGNDFIEAMITDLTKNEYANYSELKSYMYGSAACVGLIMSYVFGYKNRETLYYAEQMGYAMQMTNFIRDIKEDLNERDRIYIPIEIYEKFNLTKEDFQVQVHNTKFENLIRDQIIFTKKLYAEAEKGISGLKNGRLQTYLAGFLYSKILDKIERQNFNVFCKRARVSLLEKIYYTIKILWKLKTRKEAPWE